MKEYIKTTRKIIIIFRDEIFVDTIEHLVQAYIDCDITPIKTFETFGVTRAYILYNELVVVGSCEF